MFLCALCYHIGSDHPSYTNFRLHVIPYITVDWYKLGLKLIDEAKLEEIRMKHSDNVYCIKLMFQHWRVQTSNVTWNVLLQAIDDIGKSSLASKLKDSLILKGM